MEEVELNSKSRFKHPEVPVSETFLNEEYGNDYDIHIVDRSGINDNESSVGEYNLEIQEEEGGEEEEQEWDKKVPNSDPDINVIAKLNNMVRRTKKIPVEDAIEWVESQLHDMRLAQEKEMIATEYRELQAQMKLLEDAILDDPDQEEHEVVGVMSDSQRTKDMVMKQHFKSNNIEKLRQK